MYYALKDIYTPNEKVFIVVAVVLSDGLHIWRLSGSFFPTYVYTTFFKGERLRGKNSF
jgi:hypothetical protein